MDFGILCCPCGVEQEGSPIWPSLAPVGLARFERSVLVQVNRSLPESGFSTLSCVDFILVNPDVVTRHTTIIPF